MLFNCKGYNIITKQSPLKYLQNNNYNKTNNKSQIPQNIMQINYMKV